MKYVEQNDLLQNIADEGAIGVYYDFIVYIQNSNLSEKNISPIYLA